ncbi:YtxH domain-containing protein [Chitinophaga lutea]
MKMNMPLVGALVTGALIGAAAGVLFAPYKGAKSRRKIARQSRRIAEDLKGKFNSIPRPAEYVL